MLSLGGKKKRKKTGAALLARIGISESNAVLLRGTVLCNDYVDVIVVMWFRTQRLYRIN